MYCVFNVFVFVFVQFMAIHGQITIEFCNVEIAKISAQAAKNTDFLTISDKKFIVLSVNCVLKIQSTGRVRLQIRSIGLNFGTFIMKYIRYII